jgi:hypothetical protein
MFDIKEGILKCNDDLIFNENILESFLRSPKKHKINDNEYIDIDYMGRSNYGFEPNLSGMNDSLVHYYKNHQEDLDNPQHNLKGVNIEKFTKLPQKDQKLIFGPLTYFSNKSCKVLINHMNNINYNINHYDEKSDSYPYGFEDISIGYILLENNIEIVHSNYWYSDHLYIQDKEKFFAFHTNKYK